VAPEVMTLPKILSGQSAWVEDASGRLTYVAALEIANVTVEGLLVRLSVSKSLPDEATMIQLEFPHSPPRRDNAMERIDWRPLHRHTNKNIGPPKLHGMVIEGSHHHRFDLNWLPNQGVMRSANLPMAVPMVPEPQSFVELLELAAAVFRIHNLVTVSVPPWEADLV